MIMRQTMANLEKDDIGRTKSQDILKTAGARSNSPPQHDSDFTLASSFVRGPFFYG